MLYATIYLMNLTFKNLFKLGIFPSFVYLLNNTVQSLVPGIYLLYSLDTPAHFLGGMTIAYTANYALSLLEKRRWLTIQKNILRCGIILSVVMTIAVWWEFYEFVYDIFSPPSSYLFVMQPTVFDTIKDLYMGMFGGIVFCIGLLHQSSKKK
jgi:cytochrome c oxidase subunit IV